MAKTACLTRLSRSVNNLRTRTVENCFTGELKASNSGERGHCEHIFLLSGGVPDGLPDGVPDGVPDEVRIERVVHRVLHRVVAERVAGTLLRYVLGGRARGAAVVLRTVGAGRTVAPAAREGGGDGG